MEQVSKHKDAHDLRNRSAKSTQRSTASGRASQSASGSETKTETNADEVECGFSFAGGGWLMLYIYGVAKALRERNAHNNARFIGSSSGALVVMALHLDWDLDAIAEVICSEYIPEARATTFGAFRLREYAQRGLHAAKGLHKWPKTQQDPRKCQVVYTSVSMWESRRKSTFESEEDLLNGLLASCTATPVAGFPFKYHGEWVMDGSILDNQPRFKDEDRVKRTVLITPKWFEAAADIKPSKYVPYCWRVFAPLPDDMRWLYNLGYEDGLAWCSANGYPSASADASRDSHVARSSKQPRSIFAEYKTVLGRVTGYRSWENIGRVFSFLDKLSVHSLLQLEMTFHLAWDIACASLDLVMITCTGLLTGLLAVVAVSGRIEALVFECLVASVVYVAVYVSRVYSHTRKIKSTPTRQQIEQSLQEVKCVANSIANSNGEVHGMMAFKSFHTALPKHHHDVLMRYSSLYRISTQL